MKTTGFILLFAAMLAHGVSTGAEGLDPAVQAKITALTLEIAALARDPVLVSAVRAHNAGPPPEQAALTQERWISLSILDPLVRGFTRNPAGQFLKAHRPEAVCEAFVSGADGLKVAFLAKPSNWSHLGKPKHDEPMAGRTWQGPIELDESSGLQQIQVSVPVLDDGKPVGSLVVGLSLSKLTQSST